MKFIEKGKAIVKKSGHKIPVGTAEAWNILEFGAATNVTAKVSDFLCMNMQPFWGGFAGSCDDGSDCPNVGALVDSKAEVIALKFNKPTIICNTGWPTKGEKCCGRGRSGSLDGLQVSTLPHIQGFCKKKLMHVQEWPKLGSTYLNKTC